MALVFFSANTCCAFKVSARRRGLHDYTGPAPILCLDLPGCTVYTLSHLEWVGAVGPEFPLEESISTRCWVGRVGCWEAPGSGPWVCWGPELEVLDMGV